MHLPESIFREVVNFAPLVSIDLLIVHDSKILLGKRRNKPARNRMFVPGGRIKKHETIDDAFKRISNDELGVEIKKSYSKLLGIYEHHYDDSLFDDVTTHYVAIAYLVDCWSDLVDCWSNVHTDKQHEYLKWVELSSDNDDIHRYTKNYMEDICQLS